MWLKRLNKRHTSSTNFQKILVDLEKIRKNSDRLVLYGQSTGANWLGISIATSLIYPKEALEVPQNFSTCMLSPNQQKALLNRIIALDFGTVVFSGFAEYSTSWVQQLKGHVQIEIIYHGTFAELHNPKNQLRFAEITDLALKGDVHKVGFVSKDMAATIEKILGFNCYSLDIPKPSLTPLETKIDLDPSFVHIGVFGGDTFNKNLHNQVTHALLIDRSIVHVADKSVFRYLDQDLRIVEHGKNLPRERFLQVLGSMDLNLYCSYSESWGLVVVESEAMGVPCLGPISFDYRGAIEEIIRSQKASN